MNKITEYHNKSINQQKEIDQLDEALANNAEATTKLSLRIQDMETRFQEIELRLINSSKDLAFGRVSTDQVIALKEQAKDITQKIEAIKETLDALNEAKELLRYNIQSLKKETKYNQVITLQSISEQLLKKFANDPDVRKLITVWIGSQDPHRFNNKYDQEYLPKIFAESLFSEVYKLHESVPDIMEARSQAIAQLNEWAVEYS